MFLKIPSRLIMHVNYKRRLLITSCILRDIWLLPRCKWDLRSSGMLPMVNL